MQDVGLQRDRDHAIAFAEQRLQPVDARHVGGAAGHSDIDLVAVQQGVAAFGNDDKPFLSLLIAVSLQAGKPDDAQRYLGECLMAGDEGLASDCRLAAGKKAEPKHRSPFGLPFVP